MHKKICENNNIYVKYAKIIIYKKTKVCYYQGIERRKRGKEMGYLGNKLQGKCYKQLKT